MSATKKKPGRNVKIQITGPKCSGKTTLIHIIGTHLRNLGFNVAATDDGQDLICEPRPVRPDAKWIVIETQEGRVP